jgi:ABC-2 type transport system ATP-binding protein
VIAVTGLTKQFGATPAVDGVTFEVPAGEIFGFVGPNGAGKTTTIRILATLLRPDSGNAVIDGVDVTRQPEKARRRLGFMPDFFGVYDRLTAWEYLTFYAACYGVPRPRRAKVISDLLELVDLADRRDSAVDTLSRGMKQRLCLARALVHDPAVLLLDEPASGLDPRARVEMRGLLQELRTMGKTILISSHILPELTELCSMIGIIDQGQMRATGPVREVVRKLTPGRRLLIELLERQPEALALTQQFPTVQHAELTPSGIEVAFSGDEQAMASLLRAMVNAGLPVVAFTSQEAGLEDAFLKVTGVGEDAA